MVILLLPARFDQYRCPSCAESCPCRRQVGAASSSLDLCRRSGSIEDRIQVYTAACQTSFPRGAAEEYLSQERFRSWSKATRPASPPVWRQRNSQVELGRNSWRSMVIGDRYFKGVPIVPPENEAPLLVYSDAPLACEITRESFKTIARRNPHVVDALCIMQLHESSPCP
jgi:hypothetical protein